MHEVSAMTGRSSTSISIFYSSAGELAKLMEEGDKIPVTGKVVWVTPKGAQGGRTPGIGIQLSTDDSTLINKIENYLAGSLSSERKTNAL